MVQRQRGKHTKKHNEGEIKVTFCHLLDTAGKRNPCHGEKAQCALYKRHATPSWSDMTLHVQAVTHYIQVLLY